MRTEQYNNNRMLGKELISIEHEISTFLTKEQLIFMLDNLGQEILLSFDIDNKNQIISFNFKRPWGWLGEPESIFEKKKIVDLINTSHLFANSKIDLARDITTFSFLLSKAQLKNE